MAMELKKILIYKLYVIKNTQNKKKISTHLDAGCLAHPHLNVLIFVFIIRGSV